MRIPFTKEHSSQRSQWLATAKKVFYGLLVLLAAALIFAFDATWPILEHVLIVAIEFLEQELDHFYDDTLGFGHYYGQMATAWTGFFLFLALLVFAFRFAMRIARQTRAQLPEWREHQKEQVHGWWLWAVERFNGWWQPLSLPRKIAAGTAGVLIAIPVAWILAVVVTTLILAVFGF